VHKHADRRTAGDARRHHVPGLRGGRRCFPVPADGETIGEIMFGGNIVMKGCSQNPSADAIA